MTKPENRPFKVSQLAGPSLERIVRVRVGQQRRDRQEDLRDRQRRAPLALQNVEANAAVVVHVAVVDLRRELDLRARDSHLVRRRERRPGAGGAARAGGATRARRGCAAAGTLGGLNG